MLFPETQVKRLQLVTFRYRLEEQGYIGSYASVHRFVSKLKPHTPNATVRVERKPGKEGQADFGYAETTV